MKFKTIKKTTEIFLAIDEEFTLFVSDLRTKKQN